MRRVITHSPSETLPGTKARIAAEALRLFAERGFDATTVSDIQSAVGLSAGSGALYKHFASKEEVLQAAVARQAERLRSLRAGAGRQRVTDLRAALRSAARFVLAALAAERDLMRVILRDGDRFPDALAQIRSAIVATTYDAFELWLREQVAAGHVREHDSRAIAAVGIASLVLFRVDEMVFDEPPGSVAEDRFVDAWVELMMGLASPTGRKSGR